MARRSQQELLQLRKDHSYATGLLAEAGAQLQKEIPNSKALSAQRKIAFFE